MRISFIVPTLSNNPSGGLRIIFEHAKRLALKKHVVFIIFPRSLQNEASMINNLRTIKYRFSGKPSVNWFKFPSNLKILKVPSLNKCYIPTADVLIATAWETAYLTSNLPVSKGEKFYFIQHHETWSGSRELVNATWKMPFKKIVIAKWLQELVYSMGEEAIIVPNAVDTDFFKITTPIERRIHQRVGMLYHELKWKGSKDGLRAVELVKKKLPDLELSLFSVYAKGPEVPDYAVYYHNVNQEKIRDIYNSCAIFINPSWTEGWGLTAVESMACGCALISTDIEATKEYALDGQNALLTPVKNPQKMAEAITQLIESNELRITLARNGCDYIQRNFSWTKSSDLFEKALTFG